MISWLSCSALGAKVILGVSLRVMLLQDSCMLRQESLSLLGDDFALTLLLHSLKFLLGFLGFALLLIDNKFLFPQALDLALVFQLTHAASLSIHLLQTVILCEFLHQLALELFFHSFLFLGALHLESELVLSGSLEFLSDLDPLLSFSTLLELGSFLSLLHVKVVSELLLEHLLSHSLLLLGGQLLEDLVADRLGLLLHRLDLVLAGLLLFGVSAHHLVFVLIHLLLPFQKSSLFILRKDHISLRLLFLLENNS